MDKMIITIDGPTASGKSSVARLVAGQLNLYYIASGALFRALGYIFIHDLGYTVSTITQARESDIQKALDPKVFIYHYDSVNGEHISYKGNDITPYLKSPECDVASSLIGTQENVRDALRDFQRGIAKKYAVIVDGRDCGSVVFPNASFKFFITASLEQRGLRWQHMQKKLGNVLTLAQAISAIQERDERDSTREVAPLTVPHGAIVIDSSAMIIDKVVDFMCTTVLKKNSER